jgi:hypothetical protein
MTTTRKDITIQHPHHPPHAIQENLAHLGRMNLRSSLVAEETSTTIGGMGMKILMNVMLKSFITTEKESRKKKADVLLVPEVRKYFILFLYLKEKLNFFFIH